MRERNTLEDDAEARPAPTDESSPFEWSEARRPDEQPVATKAIGGQRAYLYRRSVIHTPPRNLDDHRPRRQRR